MCVSINYIFPECLCTSRVGWYTCFLARSDRNDVDGSSSSSKDDKIAREGGGANFHETCTRYKYTVQQQRNGGIRCAECLSEVKSGDGDASESGGEGKDGAGGAAVTATATGNDTADVGTGGFKESTKSPTSTSSSGLAVAPLKIGKKDGKLAMETKDSKTQDQAHGHGQARDTKNIEIKPLKLRKASEADKGAQVQAQVKLLNLSIRDKERDRERDRQDAKDRAVEFGLDLRADIDVDPVKRIAVSARSSSLGVGSAAGGEIGGIQGKRAMTSRRSSRERVGGEREKERDTEREKGYEGDTEGKRKG